MSDKIQDTYLIRLPEVLRRYPVAKSTWWAGVKSGRYPAPIKLLGVNCSAWRPEDIDGLIQETCK